MQRVKIRTKQVVSLLAMGYLALHVGTASPVLASGGHGHDDECSNRTLKGTYVFTQDGFENRAPNPEQPTQLLGDRRPFAYAGVENYNGRGNMRGNNSLAVARRTDQVPTADIVEFSPYTGTYTVNSDCTGTAVYTDVDGFKSTYNLFVSPDGERYTFLIVTSEVIIDDANGNPVVTPVQDLVGVGIGYRSNR